MHVYKKLIILSNIIRKSKSVIEFYYIFYYPKINFYSVHYDVKSFISVLTKLSQMDANYFTVIICYTLND